METIDPQPVAPAALKPEYDVRVVLDEHGPAALSTRIHVPDKIVDELLCATGAAPRGEVRARIRQAGRKRDAWTCVAPARLTLRVEEVGLCHLIATPLVDRDPSRPSAWLLIVDEYEPLAGPPEVADARSPGMLDAIRDLDAGPLHDAFAAALTGIVEPAALDQAVAQWLAESAAQWVIKSPETGPRDLYTVRLGGELDLDLEALAGESRPLRARFGDLAPDPGRLLGLLVPHLSAAALALGPAGTPAALRFVWELEQEAAEGLLQHVSERAEKELRCLSPALLGGAELSAEATAVCERRWGVSRDDGAALIAELLGDGGSAVEVVREATPIPSWTLRTPLARLSLRLPRTGERLVVAAIDASQPPGSLCAEDLRQCDDAFAPWTLVEFGDDIVDEAIDPRRGDVAERRRRLEERLRRVGALRAAAEPGVARVEVDATLAFVARRADTIRPRVTITEIDAPLISAWREYPGKALLAVRFLPGVGEGLNTALGLPPGEAGPVLWRLWSQLRPRSGIDHPPRGRADVSAWLAFEIPDASGRGPCEAHLAFVADHPRLWGPDSIFAVGFIADARFGLPAPAWLRDPRIPIPIVAELAAAARAAQPDEPGASELG